MDIGLIEYRVRPVTRYVITRHHEDSSRQACSTATKGEYENPEVAFEVAYALCKAEHERLGLPVDDERIQYPRHPGAVGEQFPRSTPPPAA